MTEKYTINLGCDAVFLINTSVSEETASSTFNFYTEDGGKKPL
jgi:hypothetical protein